MKDLNIISFKTNTDLTNKLGYFVKIIGDNTVDICNNTSKPVGVIYDVAASKSVIGVKVYDKVKVIAGENISANDLIVSDNNGKAKKFTEESPALIRGIALTSGAVNDFIEILLI